jgi:hypothetical protein
MKDEAFTLRHDSAGRLIYADSAGREVGPVAPVRAFPITDPERGVALVDADGREVHWFEDLGALGAADRKMIDDELSRREFVPVIEQIVSVSSATEPSEWKVETDRGTTLLVLKNEDDVRRIGEWGAVIVDADAVRYLIADLRQLDAASRRFLERYL